MLISRRAQWLSLAWALGLLLAGAPSARAQVMVWADDDVNFRLGVLGQFQADWLTVPAADVTTQNLFIRRFRLMFGGQVAKYVTFYAETDVPNLGKTLPAGKNISPGVVMQDAWGEFKPHDVFALDAGLMFVPFSRNSLQSAATLLPIDYGANTFNQSVPTQSTLDRDTGFQAKGYFLADHLEYRIGVFQGARSPLSDNSFRYAGRVQYEFLESEGTGFFYTGTYLGEKRVLAVGAAFDRQSDYHAYDVDVFVDHPIGPGAVTGQLDYSRLDGSTKFLTLPKQNNVLLELGYYFSRLKLTPVFQFTNRNVADTSVGDATQWSVGANYWWAGHNANVKGAYTRISPRGLADQNEFTIQLQLFYY